MAHSTAHTLTPLRDRLLVTYASLGNENGAVFEGWEYPDKTIQASGTGTVTLFGSNDGTNFVALNSIAGAPVSLAAASNASAVVLENPKFMRAVNTSDTGALIVITCSR